MADKILFANIVKSTLAAGISDVAVSLAVQAGHGTKFPNPSAGEYFKVKLKDATGNYEIVHCTARAVDTLTIVRAREGTTERAFAGGDKVEIVLTKETLETFPQRGVIETIDGDKTYSGLSDFTGKTKFANGIGPDYKNNYGLVPSVNLKALTVAFVGNDGTNASAANPAEISFRSATATTGTSVRRNVVGALSIVSPSGATHGFTASQTGYLYYYALDNAGAVELSVSGSNKWDEGTLQSTTAISAASDSADVLYSTVARANVAIRYLGRIKIQTGVIPGEWDNEDTEVTVHALGFFNTELTGAPKAPTPAASATSTEVATAEFVQRALSTGATSILGTHLFGIEDQTQNTTRYIGENGLVSGATSASGTEADLIWWPLIPIRIKDLMVFVSPSPAAGQTDTLMVRKNGADTGLTVTVTSAGGVFSDTSNSVVAGPGDYISFRSVTSATSGTVSVSASVRFVDPVTGYGVSCIPFSVLSSVGAGIATIGLTVGTPSNAEPHAYPVASPDVYVTGHHEQAATGGTQFSGYAIGAAAGTYSLQLRSGGGVYGGTTTDVGANFTGMTPLTASSYFRPSIPIDGAAVRHAGSFSLGQKTAGILNQVKPLFMTSKGQVQASTRYMGGHGCAGHATEGFKQSPLTAGKLKNFILLNEGAGVAGQTWTANVRKNGATVLTLTLTGAAVVTSDTTTEITWAATDRLSVEVISSATTGTRDIQFACDHLAA